MNPQLEELLSSCLAPLGLDVEAVELSTAKRRVLMVAVDGDQGVGIDVIAQATRAISAALDADAAADRLIGTAPYTLEVTSRGVDRPLTLPRHWRRNTGRLVQVVLADEQRFTGRVVANDETTVTLAVETAEQQIALADITRAVVQVELNRKDGH